MSEEFEYRDPHGDGNQLPGREAAELLLPAGFWLSEPCDLLMTALVEASRSIRNPIANRTANITSRTGASYSYGYSDLPATLECVREPMAAAGLALLQVPGIRPDDVVSVTSILSHTSGQRLVMRLDLPVSLEGEPRDLFNRVGGAVTWLRRTSIGCLFPISSEAEVDGSQRESLPPQGPPRRQVPVRPPAPGKTPAHPPKAATPPLKSGESQAAPPAPESTPFLEWRANFEKKCNEAATVIGWEAVREIIGRNGFKYLAEVDSHSRAGMIVEELRAAAKAFKESWTGKKEPGTSDRPGAFVNAQGVLVDDSDVPFGGGGEAA